MQLLEVKDKSVYSFVAQDDMNTKYMKKQFKNMEIE